MHAGVNQLVKRKPLTPALSPEYRGEGAYLRALLIAVACVFATARLSFAGPQPSVTGMTVRGLQAGGTTTVILTGSDLLPDPKLITLAPITKQEVKTGATPARVEMDITL